MPSKTASASPDAEDAPKTPKKGKAKAVNKKTTTASAGKKRKVQEAEVEEDEVDEDVKAESDD
jgi:hypothetical protein